MEGMDWTMQGAQFIQVWDFESMSQQLFLPFLVFINS